MVEDPFMILANFYTSKIITSMHLFITLEFDLHEKYQINQNYHPLTIEMASILEFRINFHAIPPRGKNIKLHCILCF